METKILVTYASRHGATAEIAGKIAEIVAQNGFLTEVLPVDQVDSVEDYSAVIMGNAVYAGQWNREAVHFLETQEKALAKRPVWIFSSGPTGEGDPVELTQGWRFPLVLQGVIDRIAPQEIVVFHGELDTDKLNIGERLIIRVVKAPTGDFRDWDMITEWANEVAKTMKTLLSQPHM
jgi:menaquinone-dependent protoporphyrinogen oxidase